MACGFMSYPVRRLIIQSAIAIYLQKPEATSLAPFVEKAVDTTAATAAVAEIVSQIVPGSAYLGHDLL